MNCEQCGAPMNVAEGQSSLHCAYCGSYHFPVPNLDGVALLDEISRFTCPVCTEPLVMAVIQDIRIFSCLNCRGNLIEQSRMLPILRQAKLQEPSGEGPRSLQNKTELTRIAPCPSCGRGMAVYPYGGPGNVIIQGCDQCELIWLDYGELSKIIRSYGEMYDHPSDDLGAKKKWIPY